MTYFMILLQIGIKGFDEAAEVSTLMGVLVSTCIILAGVVVYLFKNNLNKNQQIVKLQSEASERLMDMSEDHINKLELIRKEVMRKDDKRSNEKKETEREILSILNGLSQILELGQARTKSENMILHNKLEEINSKLNTIIDGLIYKK